MKKSLSLILIISLIVLSITGCGKKKEEKLYDYNDPFMTDLEYEELFALEQEVKAEKVRNIEKQIIDIYPVSYKDRQQLMSQLQEDLDDLNKNVGFSNNKYIHEYYKHLLDNLIIDGPVEADYGTSAGFYYATVKGDFIKNPNIDEIRKVANYLGITGAIGYDLEGNESVDEVYLKLLIDKVNENREAQDLDPVDTEIEQINYIDDTEMSYFFENPEFTDVVGTGSEVVIEDNSEEYERKLSEINLFEEIETKSEEDEQDIFQRKVRRLNYDAKEFNDVAGIANNSITLIPNINAIFKLNQSSKMAGYSLYDYGTTFDPTKSLKYHLELVFMYQRNLETEKFELKSIFPKSMKEISGKLNIKKANQEYILPFTRERINIIIDYLHHAISDSDATALTCGDLVYPQDLGLALLLQRQSYKMQNQEMYVKEILTREKNTYVCDVPCIISFNINNTPGTATKLYIDYLIRVEVKDAEISIIDMAIKEIECLRYPVSDTYKGYKLKLYSLEHTHTLDEADALDSTTVKQEIMDTVINPMVADINRIYNEEIYPKGKVKNGKRECVNYSSPLLSNAERLAADESLRQRLRKYFTKHTTILHSRDLDKIIETFINIMKTRTYKNVPKVYVDLNEPHDIYYDTATAKLQLYFDWNDKRIEDVQIADSLLSFNKYNDIWLIDNFQMGEQIDTTVTSKKYKENEK